MAGKVGDGQREREGERADLFARPPVPRSLVLQCIAHFRYSLPPFPPSPLPPPPQYKRLVGDHLVSLASPDANDDQLNRVAYVLVVYVSVGESACFPYITSLIHSLYSVPQYVSPPPPPFEIFFGCGMVI